MEPWGSIHIYKILIKIIHHSKLIKRDRGIHGYALVATLMCPSSGSWGYKEAKVKRRQFKQRNLSYHSVHAMETQLTGLEQKNLNYLAFEVTWTGNEC
ncbi:hypothetical protein CEXT_449451 [Caerostris extrusa]|uniref:Uncharacterized protein n=1 Tax=Caerostris extrusa TaxID=172846 RepID=A0AAV4YDY2_CAEEX|nr:hypothetical protein CEXT_449451 [Caerostris extrusa]